MKKLSTYFLLLSLLTLTPSAATRAVQGGKRKDPPAAPTSAPAKPGRPTRTTPAPARKTPAPAPAELTINSEPGSTVFVNNQQRGMTDASGKYIVRDLKPGQVRITVRKQNYHELTRVLALAAGEKRPESFQLAPVLATLNVSTNVPGAWIVVTGVGEYTDRATNIQLQPGVDHQLSASKLGYKTSTQSVRLAPGQTLSVPLTLERMTTEELISAGRESLNRQNYPEAVDLFRTALSAQPNHSTASLLLGWSYYANGNFNESLEAFGKAIALNEKVVFPVRHRHGLRDMCNGAITLGKNTFAFQSRGRLDESYEVPYANFREVEVQIEIGQAHYLHTKIRDLRRADGKKEGEKDLNFYVPEIDSRFSTSACVNCRQRMGVIEQLILTLRGQASK